MDRAGYLPGYGTVWYEPTGIANILSMSRATKKFRVVFNSKGRNYFRLVLPDRGVRFQLSPNGLYYFDAADRENIVLLINTVSENQDVLHGGSKMGPGKRGERCTCWGSRWSGTLRTWYVQT